MGIKKTSKGEISIEDFRGRIRLRWRYGGERYSLNLPFPYLPENLHHATVKATEIKLDIMKRSFDPSLLKYKSAPIAKPDAPKLIETPPAIVETKLLFFLHDLASKFNDWVRNIRNVDVDNTNYYLTVRRLLQKWIGISIADIPQMLNAEKLAACTYNDRLTVLKSFLIWLLETGLIDKNPLKDVRRKRNKNKGKIKNPRRLPLSEQQIAIFLKAIKEDSHCPSASRFKHSHYYPFLTFVFYTGVRNAEAIGLRVRHVNIVNKQVEISEAFARTIKGTNHSARVQKGTKTENIRYLPLTDELAALLEGQIADKNLSDFVFLSPKGLSIDDRMLQRRIITPVLKKLGFEKRDLYAARHSFGTRAIQQGMALTDLAYLMGHSTIDTASRNYVHVGKPAKALPTIQ